MNINSSLSFRSVALRKDCRFKQHDRHRQVITTLNYFEPGKFNWICVFLCFRWQWKLSSSQLRWLCWAEVLLHSSYEGDVSLWCSTHQAGASGWCGHAKTIVMYWHNLTMRSWTLSNYVNNCWWTNLWNLMSPTELMTGGECGLWNFLEWWYWWLLKTLVLSKKVESEVSIITEGNFYSRQRKANTILFKPGYSLAVKMIPISIMTFKPVYILPYCENANI